MDDKLVTIDCDECGEHIPADNWTEHTDYHVAMQLQRSINQSSPISRVMSSPHQSVKRRTTKRLSNDKAMLKKMKTASCTLDKFLTKK